MAYCPECNMEYRDGIESCSDCDVALAEGTPPAMEDVREGEWVTVETVGTDEEARLIQGFLQSAGIEVQLDDRKDDNTFNVTIGGLSDMRIQVRPASEADAVRLLEERETAYDESIGTGTDDSLLTADGEMVDIDEGGSESGGGDSGPRDDELSN